MGYQLPTIPDSITIAGHTVLLGGTQNLAASDLTNGTTGSGNIVLAASPSLTTPTLGVAGGTSLALGGATLGGNALAVSGASTEIGSLASASTTPADGAIFTVQNSSTTAFTIYDAYLGTDFFYADAIRSAIVVPSGANNITTTAFGGYVFNEAAAFPTGGILRGAASVLFGQAVSSVDDAQTWGIAIAFNDTSPAAPTSGRFLNGIELDYQVNSTTNNGTHVQGPTVILNAPFATVEGNGFQCSVGSVSVGKWDIAFCSDNGAATQAIHVGAAAASGTSINSQTIEMAWFDSGGTGHQQGLYAGSDGYLNWPGGGLNLSGNLVAANQVIEGGIIVAASGYLINQSNLNGNIPGTSFNGAAIGWNYNGLGEVDFFNTFTSTGSTDAFTFSVMTSPTTKADALFVGVGGSKFFGNLVVGGSLTVDNEVILTGQTSSPGSGAGTLTNAPSAGNPNVWLQVSINGTTRFIPAW